MKFVKRLLFVFSLGLLYLVFREFLEIYYYLSNIDVILSYFFLVIILFFLGYFVIVPLYQIFKLPKNLGPTRNKSIEDILIQKRLNAFQSNPNLSELYSNLDKNLDSRARYIETIKYLEKKCDLIRKTRVANLFYSSAISQNGFIDAILILSASINIVKEIFILYNGRVSNTDLLIIAKHTYYSIAIGGSEMVEYPVEEIYSKLASEGVKSVPFVDKILASIADGFVNATLLTRVSLITENYCKLTYIEAETDIYPKSKSIVEATKAITADIKNKFIKATINFAKDKTTEKVLNLLNPLGFIMEKAVDKVFPSTSPKLIITKEGLKQTARWIGNPIVAGIGDTIKLIKSIK